jgi:hypothetical protein
VSGKMIKVRVLFADSGAFHHEDLAVPESVAQDYDRLIDGLREDPEALKRAYLDLGRLCAAWLLEDDAD